MKRPRTLLENSRFYILASAVLLSIVAACWLRLSIPGDQLFYIRLQQVFGLIAVLLIYLAVILTPLSKLVGKGRLSGLLFARRAIGVSAAYFSLLHTVIAVTDQVGGLAGLQLLPERFKAAFLLGAIALLVLLLMAATSFDKMITFMTFRRWKLLHRFIYAAIALVVVHVWLIGTHADDIGIRIATAAALLLLFGLESVRLAQTVAAKYRLSLGAKIAAGAVIFGMMAASLALLPLLSKNYHSDHHAGSTGDSTR